MHKRKAFTLVELIVVITILAILATIAFLSFQGYSSSARDSIRLADLTNLTKSMEIILDKGGTLPRPSSPIALTVGATTIGYQGYADKSVLGILGMSDSKDPLDTIYYTYSTNATQTKYQVLGFLESGDLLSRVNPVLDQVYADPASYSGRTLVTKGQGIGILLEPTTFLPVQIKQQDIDVSATNTGYLASFDSKDSTPSLTGSLLFSNIYNRRKDLLVDKTMTTIDSSLVGYWDMETLCQSGGCGAGNDGKLKDLTGKGNYGVLHGGVILGDVQGTGKTGKATSFNGSAQYIDTGTSINLGAGDFSVVLLFKTGNNPSGNDDVISKGMGPFNGAGLGFEIRTRSMGTMIEACVNNGTGCPRLQTSGIPSSGWNGFGMVVSRSSEKSSSYVNGQFSKQMVIAPTYTDTYPLNIGAGYDSAYRGAIDEVRIYNRALSDSEFATIYSTSR